MSGPDFPDLPSDEELGITEEDLKDLEDGDLPDDGPEMSDEELMALLGETREPAKAMPGSGTPAPPKGGVPKEALADTR